MTEVNRPHGQSSVKWKGNVLVIKPIGAFNMEGIAQVAVKIKQAISNRPNGSWIRLYVFQDKDTLGPVDSLEPVVQAIRASKEIGCKMLISVGGSVINRESFEIISERAGIPLMLCDSEEEALEIAAAAL